MTLIYFIIVLGVTVLIHEFGHFIFAKKAGVYVYEFSIGMGPKLFSFKRKNDETVYSIRLFPIGGFVSMAGEDMEDKQGENSVPSDRQLCNKPWINRFMTIIAGVLFNFLLAFVILFVIGLVNGSNIGKTYVADVEEDYPAYNILFEGDEITAINGKKINNAERLALELQVNSGKEISLTVKSKSGDIRTEKITPKKIEDGKNTSYLYGFSITTNVKYGFFEAIKYAFVKIYNLLEQMVLIIVYLCTGKLSLNSLSGPIGIFKIVDESAKAGILSILYLIAYLCINVGFINLIPLPAFDGGRALFLVIEKIKGSRVKPEIENTIHSVGFILLMILMIVVSWNDILRIFS